MRHEHLTSPWSGQAAVKPASIPMASCLPLRGSVIRIPKTVERQPHLVPGGSTIRE